MDDATVMLTAIVTEALRDYASSIITIAAALGVLATAGRYIWRRALQPFIEVQNAAAEIIKAQLTPNHGSSLVDKVNRIATNHQEAQRHWEGLEKGMEEVRKRLEKVEAATATPRDPT